MSNYNSIQYFLDDYPKTLFPLSTTKIILENNGHEILENYIYQKILNKNEPEYSFFSQVRCYASKHSLHLRRTVKLDPVAELFIYDLVYRNRATFRKDFNPCRRSFGYRFQDSKPISDTKSYGDFKAEIALARQKYKFSIKFDISSYFNSVYHHDLVAWFSEANRSNSDVETFGQFLRETNGGRTVDCLPQGIHPCKLIGSEFIKFVDNSIRIQCELLLRFMDDFYLFSDDENKLNSDFITIQKILGEKGLSLNSAKTLYGGLALQDLVQTIDDIKVSLLQLRREIIDVSGFANESYEENEYEDLSEEQIDYLLNLLKEPDIDESDAELVLVLLRDYEYAVFEQINKFLEIFPSLIRNIYNFCREVKDVTTLSDLLLQFLNNGINVTEDQLFWLAKISEDFLSNTPKFQEILRSLYYHQNATVISSAKVLEIPEKRFGMDELRREHLSVGKSDWLAWASAVGCRCETAISRNHILSYFSKASAMNKIIADCIKNLP